MNLRRVQVNDLVKLMACNLQNIPENYTMRYWEYSIITWPDLSFLAEDESGKVVGYVLSSIEPEEGAPHVWFGYINSLSVLRPYRRLGLAQGLMNLSKDAMFRDIAGIEYIQLHVRKSNRPALSLYNKIGYNHHGTAAKYYADGEDAFILRLPLRPRDPEQQDRPRSISYLGYSEVQMENMDHKLVVFRTRQTTSTRTRSHVSSPKKEFDPMTIPIVIPGFPYQPYFRDNGATNRIHGPSFRVSAGGMSTTRPPKQGVAVTGSGREGWKAGQGTRV